MDYLPLYLLSFPLCTGKNSHRYRCTKKECTGLEREPPFQVLFTVRTPRNFPQISLRILSSISGFFRPPRTKTQHFYQNTPTAPFPWLLPQALGDSVKTGQREPMGLWVALSASTGDAVHTYRLRKTTSNNKLKSPYGSRAEGDLEGDGMVHKVNINPIQSLSINEP